VPRIGIVERCARLVDTLVERVHQDSPQQRLPRRQLPVERADAHTRAPGDLVRGHLHTDLRDRGPRRGDQPLGVALGVGPFAGREQKFHRTRHPLTLTGPRKSG
jgi:hypothetical protein